MNVKIHFIEVFIIVWYEEAYFVSLYICMCHTKEVITSYANVTHVVITFSPCFHSLTPYYPILTVISLIASIRYPTVLCTKSSDFPLIVVSRIYTITIYHKGNFL